MKANLGSKPSTEIMRVCEVIRVAVRDVNQNRLIVGGRHC